MCSSSSWSRSLCFACCGQGGATQRVVQSEPVGNMLLTQPRPLHSSICTAVLSLSSPPHHPPASLSAPPYTHGGGGRGGGGTCKHTPAILLQFHRDTPKTRQIKESHSGNTNRNDVICVLLQEGCVLVLTTTQTTEFFNVVSVPPCILQPAHIPCLAIFVIISNKQNYLL